jgi:hypothetical protein
MRLHFRPLGVRQYKSFHPKLESQTSLEWNPKSQQALARLMHGGTLVFSDVLVSSSSGCVRARQVLPLVGGCFLLGLAVNGKG